MAAEITANSNTKAFLQAVKLTRRFGGLTAVNAVTLDLHVGEVTL